MASFAYRYRKAIAAVGLGVRSTATAADADVPTLTSGAGAPAATSEPNGSIYMRTNGTNGDDSLYMRIAGAWVAMKCQTA
jgi:hypothetical protein